MAEFVSQPEDFLGFGILQPERDRVVFTGRFAIFRGAGLVKLDLRVRRAAARKGFRVEQTRPVSGEDRRQKSK
jgi:hypothetical protein